MIASKLKARQDAVADKQHKELATLGATMRRIARAKLRIICDAIDGLTDEEAAHFAKTAFDQLDSVSDVFAFALGKAWASSLRQCQENADEGDATNDSESDSVPAEQRD